MKLQIFVSIKKRILLKEEKRKKLICTINWKYSLFRDRKRKKAKWKWKREKEREEVIENEGEGKYLDKIEITRFGSTIKSTCSLSRDKQKKLNSKKEGENEKG